MSNIKILYSIMLTIAAINPFLACYATQEADNECINASISQQIFECSKKAQALADLNLNEQYQKLLQRIKNQYTADKKTGDDYIQKIKQSQRAWISLRDTNCAIEIHEIEIGTQASETTKNNCLARESLQRIDFINKISPNI
jgi:uncharacterized protein YecT (DUF1311 family)